MLINYSIIKIGLNQLVTVGLVLFFIIEFLLYIIVGSESQITPS